MRPWEPKFWPHSVKARWTQEAHKRHQQDKLIAEVVLAGWRIKPVLSPRTRFRDGDEVRGYELWSPDGDYRGFNTVRHKAAEYAKWLMDSETRQLTTFDNITCGQEPGVPWTGDTYIIKREDTP